MRKQEKPSRHRGNEEGIVIRFDDNADINVLNLVYNANEAIEEIIGLPPETLITLQH